MLGAGALVGLVIGLTGEGSGSLLTPLLIIFAGIPPLEAVGTSLAFGFVANLFGSWSFYHKGFVRLDLVKNLILGGLLGALGGGYIIRYLGLHRARFLDVFLLRMICSILIFVALMFTARLEPCRDGKHQVALVVPMLCNSITAIHYASTFHGRLPRMVPDAINASALMALGVRIIWL